MRRATRSTSPTSVASSDSGVLARRPSACCAPTDRRRRPARTGARSRLWASAWRLRPEARPRIATSVASLSSRDLPDGLQALRVKLARGRRADAPQRLDAQRVQERELAVAPYDEQAVGFRGSAGHLRDELGSGHADGDRQVHLLAHPGAQPHGDLGGRARDPLEARDVEERLLEAESLDARRRVAEDLEDGLARLDVGREARLRDDDLRAQPAGLRAAHPAAHPERPRLVAGGHDDACADHDGQPAQRADRRAARPTRRTHRRRRAG